MSLIRLLVAVTLWGVTFTFVGVAMKDWGNPFTFMLMRFAIASFVFLPIIIRRANNDWQAVVAHFEPALVAGAFLFVGFAALTIALKTESGTICAFIFTLSALLVPVMAAVKFKEKISWIVWSGLALASIGVTYAVWGSFNYGILYALTSAVGFAAYLVAVSRYAKKTIKDFDSLVFTGFTLAVVFVLALAVSLVMEMPGSISALDTIPWGAVLFTALLSSALAFFLYTDAVKRVAGVQAALIFALEPIIASISDYLWLGDVPSNPRIVGCVIIFTAVVLVEFTGAIAESRRVKKKESPIDSAPQGYVTLERTPQPALKA